MIGNESKPKFQVRLSKFLGIAGRIQRPKPGNEKQTLSSASSDTQPSLTPSESLPSMAPSATDVATTGGLNTSSQLEHQKQLRKTAKNAFRSVLTNLGPISSLIPSPAGPALGAVAASVLVLVDMIDGIDDNTEGFKELTGRIERLSALILYAKQIGKDDQVIAGCASKLESKLSDLTFVVDQISKQTLLEKFLNSTADKSSLTKYNTELDTLIGDFSLEIGVKTYEVSAETLDNTGKILVGIDEILVILHSWLQNQGITPSSSGLTAKRPSSAIRRRLWMEFVKSEDWEEIDCRVESEIWCGGTYVFSSKFDPEVSADCRLEVDLPYLKWSISTPSSFWYPGTYSGYLHIKTNYPFEPPRLYFETPTFSPNLVPLSGVLSVYMLFGDWNAKYKIKDIMDVVTFMLMIDPVYRRDVSDKLPGISLGFHDCNRLVAKYLAETGPDAFWRATNFFARAYSKVELIDDPIVTLGEIDVSRTVVVELLKHFTGSSVINDPPEGSTSNDPSIAFRSLEGKQISDLQKEERRWADVLAPICDICFRLPSEIAGS